MGFDREELIALMHGLDLQISHLRITLSTSADSEKTARRMVYLQTLKDRIQAQIRRASEEFRESLYVRAVTKSSLKSITKGEKYQKFSWTAKQVTVRNDRGLFVTLPRSMFVKMNGDSL